MVASLNSAMLLCLSATAPGANTAEPVDIGSRLELFVDSALVDSLTGSARRQLHHPVPADIAFAPDAPHEGTTSAYLTVFRDRDRVRLYFRGSGEEGSGHPELVCTAESGDGRHFERPRLGLVAFGGSKDNNIVWSGQGSHNFSPFLDTNPAAPADQRYKAVGGANPLFGFASPDGYHWRQVRPEPILTKGAFDSHNLAFWDAAHGEYVCFFRVFRNGVRCIDRATSKDFLTWSQPVALNYGAAKPEHLYTNNILPYHRAPHLLIGLPARFVPERRKWPDRHEPGVSDGVLMSSRDGVHFERWAEGFLLPGPDPRSWTDRTNYPAWGLIQTSPTEMSVYWTEHYRHPDLRFRRGVIRTDGFVSVRAEMAGGQLLTRPLVFQGSRLVVNYATSAAGAMRFELCGADGQPLPGFALADSEVLFGDEIEHPVAWKGQPSLAAVAGRPVRLRVELADADLYSFRFGS